MFLTRWLDRVQQQFALSRRRAFHRKPQARASLGSRSHWSVGAHACGLRLNGGGMALAETLEDRSLLTLSFAAATNLSAGSGPAGVAVGDFDGDNAADLAVANNGSSTVTVLLSSGGSTGYGVGPDPISITLGDFNNDGNSDLAVAGIEDVSVLLGNGDGSFSGATSFSAGVAPNFVAVGDFNGDGNDDLAVANQANIRVLLGDGAGGFSADTNFNAGGAPVAVAVRDLNGDGHADLAVANVGSNNVSVLLGNGAGSFSLAANISVGTSPTSVAVGDFNEDGKPDLAVANRDSVNVSVLLGNGVGGFSAATNFGVGSGPFSVTVGDFDGDHHLDLAVANFDSDYVSVLLGLGNGNFSAETDFTVGLYPYFVTTAYINLDNKPDLVVANYGSDNVSLLFNTSPTSQTAPTVTSPTTASITATTATLGGNVTSNGGATITARGVVYALTSANANPQLGGTGVTNVPASATTGVFTVNAAGLTASSGYSFVAYATNSQGTTYTTPVSTFTTLAAASAPTVTSVTVPASDTYIIEEDLNFTVNFDESVIVNTAGGTPFIPLTIGSMTRNATYVSGSGGSALLFRYTVEEGDLDTNGIAVGGSISTGGGTLKDAAGNNAVLTLNSVGSTAGVLVDGDRPLAFIVVDDTFLNIGDTATVTITFTEPVTGFNRNDLIVANAGVSAVTSSDGGRTWTATLTPDFLVEELFNVIILDNSEVTDLAGNPGSFTVAESNPYDIDTLAPVVTITNDESDIVNIDSGTIVYTFEFNELVNGFTVDDVTVTNGTKAGSFETGGGLDSYFTLVVTPNANFEGNLTVSVAGSVAQDLAGNNNVSATPFVQAVDTLAPTVTITVDDTVLKADETTTVTFLFSEAVTDFTNADLTIPNGTLSTVSTLDGGITWTATLTPAINTVVLTNVITLGNTGVLDLAGNSGTGTTDSNNYAVSTTKPTATITVDDTALKIGDTATVTFVFNEAVTDFTNADLTVANGTLSTVTTSDNITFTATLTPNTSVEDATNVITLDNTGVTNSVGNAGTGTTDSNNYAIDTVRPTTTIVVADSSLIIGETSLVTITFSEVVTGFTNADLTIANGTLSTVSSSDGGVTFTATLTPSAAVTDATNGITLDNTGVNDAIGNAGTGTIDSNNYAIDTVRPSATITVADTSLIVGETSSVTIVFNEVVTGFTNADLTIANGTLSAVTTSDDITFTATLTPSSSTTDATNVITLDNTGVSDVAGNTGSATTDSNNYAIDTVRPTATIVVADSSLIIGETSLVTITFNEAVTGFTNVDLTIANGTLSAVSSSDGGVTFTATLTPSTSVTDATNVITLANTGVSDAAGNAGSGTTDSNNYAVDTVRPTATITVADTSLIIGETSLVTITFSEAVTGFTNADLTIANGTLSALSSSDGGVTFTATLTPSASVTDATNVITLDNTGVSDVAGNTGSATTDSNNYAIDTVRPTATIVVTDNSLIIGETSLVTITFSEAITGFTNADLTIVNGTLSAVSSSDGGVTFTATLTPSSSVTDATNVITLDNTGVSDNAGNAGSSTTDSNNYAVDTVRPTATVIVTDSLLIIGETSLVTITFSEAVTGFTNADLTIANGTLSAVSSSDGGITFTATLTPSASVTDATNVITLDNTGVSDAAGNSGSATTDSNNYAIDTVRPTATSFVRFNPASEITDADVLVFRVTFSETVQNVDATDFNVDGATTATITDLTAQSSTVYDVTISGGDLAGIIALVGLNFSESQNITDAVGNACLGAEPITDESYFVLNGDFGDAPSAAQSGFLADYPVTPAEDGARHGAVGATFGTGRDVDLNPTHSANADSDDTTETDDEDGITFTASVVRSANTETQSSIIVNLQNPDAVSNLISGWMDFNQDGDWDDAGERILHNVSLGTTAGLQTVTYSIPAGAIVGDTFARFRLSSAGSSLPTGGALDGEVEDYSVTVIASTAPTEIDLPTNGTGDIYTSVEGSNIVVRQGGPTGTILFQTPLGDGGSITINGNDDTDDTLAIDFTDGNAIPAGGLFFNGGVGGNDIITVTGGSVITATYTFENLTDGTIEYEFGDEEVLIDYTGLEPVIDNTDAVHRIFDFTGGSEIVELLDSNGADDMMTITSTLGESIEFNNPTGSLTISGGSGNDTITITSLDAAFDLLIDIHGGDGDDTIALANGISVGDVTGGAGTDLLDYSAFTTAVTVNLAAGTATNTSSIATIENANGGSGADSLIGNSANNVLNGNAGNDTITGGNGNDTLNGGSGGDQLIESVSGNASLSSTRLTGKTGGGTDTLSSFESASLTGGNGNDSINAGGFTGRVTLLGGAGNDSLTGGSGNDFLDGGVGNDTLKSGAGDDQLSGGAGTDSIDGGVGTDTLIELVTGNITITNTKITGLGSDKVVNVERFEFTGDSRSNKLDASQYTLGSVVLRGGGGNDTLLGGSKDDTLDGGDGFDIAIQNASTGNQTLTDDQVSGAAIGTDSLISIEGANLKATGKAGVTLDASDFSGRATLDGGAGNDTLIGTNGPSDAPSTLNGNDGDDSIVGGSSYESLSGGNGKDTIAGNDGIDTIRGGAGNDTLLGNDGDDRMFGDDGNDRIFGGDGHDLIDGGNGNDTILGEVGHDSIKGGAGNDGISGGEGDDTIEGGAGNDTLLGGSGNDTLRPQSGRDLALGENGNDRIESNADDTISGGAGEDVLVGSAAKIDEAFVFDFGRLLS